MTLPKLIPTLDNAGRRLVLSEILGEPLGLRMERLKQKRSEQRRLEKHQSNDNMQSPKTIGHLVEKTKVNEISVEKDLP